MGTSQHAVCEPLAIVGAGCRFPGGVNDLRSYARLLAGGRDAMVEVPPSRWKSEDFYDADRSAVGKMYAKVAGFVSDAEWFDASFFGISAREATSMDPQQRMLLEVAWHALEDAGIGPASLRDTRTGVFLGIGSNDYIEREVLSSDYVGINPTSGTGVFPSVAAGRLSFALGLRGPSLAIDAACASSLVALHQAARSLWAGECDVALVAGVNFLVSPASTIYLCKAGALSPDGRCKSFDRTASGYVRGEGCGVVVLMRSSYARAAGNRVRALLRGSAINHNGASAQLTAPRGDAQEDVMRSALASAGVPGSAVSYLEAHGTASPLGDLIELRAVQRVFCAEERSAPLLVGTAKPHLGHLEAAAGMAGLLKVLVALESEELPAILHLDEPNPNLPSEGLQLLRAAHGWRRHQFPRVAGLSAFSLCGTNAHVVLSEALGARPPAADSRPARAEVLTLSAKSEPALRALALAYGERLRHASTALVDLCYSANVGRQALGVRAAVVGDSHEVMRSALEALAAGEAHPALFVAPAGAKRRLDKLVMSPLPEALAAASRSLLGTEPDAALVSADRKAVCRLWAQVFVLGAAVDFAPDYRGQAAQRVDIPLYPFQRSFFAAGAPARRGGLQASVEVTPPAHRPPAAPAPDEGSGLRVNPRMALGSARQIELFLRTWIAQRTSSAPASIDEDAPFSQFGLGSADALELTRALSERLGRELSITLAWDHPSIRLLSAHLVEEASAPLARRTVVGARTLSDTDGIAVVGAACRLPGAADLDSYWRLLSEGREAIGPVPDARWSKAKYYDPQPGVPGKMYTDHGGFLGEVDGFDAAFFGISSREAASMDPQQRLLLELAWEALEHAGVVPGQLAGSATGVYVGIGSYDYAQRRVGTASLTHIDGYAGTGNSGSAASGRIAYLLDLKGPTLSIDTACSSSLVALHVACQALERGEIDLAIVGGVNLLLSPATSIFFCALNALAPDGRCKVFDARADGYVRSEGGVVLVLKRATDAERAGDRTLAVVRGTAVVQDGRTNGLTAPNGSSQRTVIERARSAAGVAAEHVGYVEAHGTGTRLGDAIELSALAETAGAARSQPLRVGSVKANLGHTEAAAGLAGVLKAVLALHHRQLPPQINFVTPSSEVTWEDGRLAVPTALESWPQGAPFAGVSSFGFTGTNAHAVLAAGSSAEADQRGPVALAKPRVLTLSARSKDSLERLLQRYAAADGPLAGEADVARITYGAAVRRSHHRQRVAVLGGTAQSLRDAISAELAGQSSDALIRGVASNAVDGALVFVFPGQGGQWAGMGRELYESDQAFRAELDRCHAAMAAHLRVPLLEILGIATAQDRPFPTETELVQPALSALQMAHAAMWRARGVEPAAVIGHSMGEVAAAQVAGALSLEDAARVICVRSRLLGELRGRGAMALVAAAHSRVERDIVGMSERVSVAAANGPLETVVTGDAAAIDELVAKWQREALFCRRVEVDAASHSPQVEPLLSRLAEELAGLRPRDTGVTFFSTVRAGSVAGGELSAAYWVRNLRDTVRFAGAMDRALDAGHSAFLELGAHPSLVRAMNQNAEARGERVVCVATEERGGSAGLTVSRSLATLYTAGMTPSWFAAEARQPPCELPVYPFERKRHWLEEPSSAQAEDGARHADLCYEVRWQPAAASGVGEGLRAARWLVLGPLDGVATALRAAGSNVTHALRGEEHGDYTRLLEEMRVAGPFHVLCPASMGFATAATEGSAQVLLEETVRGCEWLLGLCRAVKTAGAGLWLVTRTAQQVLPADLPSLSEATLSGLASVVALEEAALVSGIIDGDGRAESERGIAAWLLSGCKEDVAVRAGRHFVPRLRRAARPREAAPALDAAATYLVTGGFGHLGLKVARWLAQRGARRLWLVGRRLPEATGAVERALNELAASGVTVITSALDIGDEAALAAALAQLPAEHPLRGVVHCAGLQRAHDALACDRATLSEVLHPKLAGGYALHRVTEHVPLDFFVLFSSAASIWGSTQAGAYAAANRSLDALAQRRRSAGLPATSVNWGRWPSGGVVDPAVERAFDAIGLLELGEEDAFLALTAAIESGQAQTTVAAVDWSRFRPMYEARRPRPLLHALPASGAPEPSAAPASASEPSAPERESALMLRLRSMPAGRRTAALAEATRTKIAKLLGLDDAGQVSDREGFFQMGLNSLMALELKNHLERELGTTLASTLAFEHPTVAALAAHLGGTLFAGNEPVSAALSEPLRSTEVAHLPAPAAALAELSDDQLGDLLTRKLSAARAKF